MNLSKSSVLFQIMRIYQCRQLQIICNAYYSWIPFINHTTKCNKKSYAHYCSHIVSQLHDYEKNVAFGNVGKTRNTYLRIHFLIYSLNH